MPSPTRKQMEEWHALRTELAETQALEMSHEGAVARLTEERDRHKHGAEAQGAKYQEALRQLDGMRAERDALSVEVENLKIDLLAETHNVEDSVTKIKRLRTIEEAAKVAVPDFLFTGKSGAPKRSWYENGIYNESRLYDALGKEDARTVLAHWNRYADFIEAVRALRGQKPGEVK